MVSLRNKRKRGGEARQKKEKKRKRKKRNRKKIAKERNPCTVYLYTCIPVDRVYSCSVAVAIEFVIITNGV